jgi:hypothetical protein
MSGSPDHERPEQPARATEVFATIVAALAADEIVRGALGSFHRLSWTTQRSEKISIIAMMVATIFTAIRFYHGNAVYLANTYRGWKHNHWPEEAKLPVPATHAIDVCLHLFEYVMLVGVGISLETVVSAEHVVNGQQTKPNFGSVYWWYVALLAGDIVWVGLTQLLRGKDLDNTARSAQMKWATINAVLIIFCIVAEHIPIENSFNWTPSETALSFSVVMTAAAFIDYLSSSQFYFESGLPDTLVGVIQADKTLGYVGEVLLDERVEPTDAIDIASVARKLFGFFLDNSANRSKMFERRKNARLHVGIYVRSGETLKPVIRFHDKGMVLTNASYFIGSSYVGAAYTRFLEKEEAAGVFYDRPDGRDDERLGAEARDRSLSHYRSGIHVPLRSKDGILFGTVVATSSQESYFVRSLHLQMFSLVARKLARIIEEAAKEMAPADYLIGAFPDPHVKEVNANG